MERRDLYYSEIADCSDAFDKQKAAYGITFDCEEAEELARLAFIDEYAYGNDDPQLTEIITTYKF